MVAFAAAVPALHLRHRSPSSAVATGLRQLGLPLGFHAAMSTGVLVAFAVLCLAVDAVIVHRRPDQREAWVVATFLALVGTVNAPAMEALAWRYPSATTAAAGANTALVALLLAVLVTFPDGRPVPRVAGPIAAASVLVLAVLGWGRLGDDLPDAWFVVLLVAITAGLAAQVHRYRRVSDWERRQQTKWVVIALGLAVAGQIVFPLVSALPALSNPGAGAVVGEAVALVGVTGGFASLVIAFGVAVLRHRLWDVDIVVNRTLVYGGLTLAITTVYVLAVIAAERLVGTWAESIVTLALVAVIALFLSHARDRLQRSVNRLMYGQRDEPYGVLARLGRRLHDATEPASITTAITDTLAGALRVPYVGLTLDSTDHPPVPGSGFPGDVLRVPVIHHDQQVACLHVPPRSPGEAFNPADVALLDDLARQIAAPLAALRLTEELDRARKDRIVALEEERRRLRRDLHDGLGPTLAAMTLQAEVARDLIRSDPDRCTELLDGITHQLHASTGDIRRLVYGLRPPALDDLGLTAALARYLADLGSAGLTVHFTHPERLAELPAAVEVAAFRIVQEAVTNVLRHAKATTCEVRLTIDGDVFTVSVQDDGTGMTCLTPTGVGLRSIRERVAELGGTCTINSSSTGGTSLIAQLPHAASTRGFT